MAEGLKIMPTRQMGTRELNDKVCKLNKGIKCLGSIIRTLEEGARGMDRRGLSLNNVGRKVRDKIFKHERVLREVQGHPGLPPKQLDEGRKREFAKHTRNVRKELKEEVKNIGIETKMQNITKCLEKRSDLMLNNQGRFINNIMGNSKGALKIDKAIKCNDNGLIEIVDHPNQVKEEIRKGMEIWHSDKPSVQDNIINWRKELEPEDKIDPEIYEGLMLNKFYSNGQSQ